MWHSGLLDLRPLDPHYIHHNSSLDCKVYLWLYLDIYNPHTNINSYLYSVHFWKISMRLILLLDILQMVPIRNTDHQHYHLRPYHPLCVIYFVCVQRI